MERLKEILKEEIETYKSWKSQQDKSYCMDGAYLLVTHLKHIQCQEIMEELIKE